MYVTISRNMRPPIYAVNHGNIKFKIKTVFQNLPNTVCSGRFATFRFDAFIRSKLLPVSSVGSRGEAPLKPTVSPRFTSRSEKQKSKTGDTQ